MGRAETDVLPLAGNGLRAGSVLSVARYRFRFRMKGELVLPEYAGSLLRGQFGAALRPQALPEGVTANTPTRPPVSAVLPHSPSARRRNAASLPSEETSVARLRRSGSSQDTWSAFQPLSPPGMRPRVMRHPIGVGLWFEEFEGDAGKLAEWVASGLWPHNHDAARRAEGFNNAVLAA